MDLDLNTRPCGVIEPLPSRPLLQMIRPALAAADALLELYDESGDLPRFFKAADAARDLRAKMWSTPATTLEDLVWKLEQAVYYVDVEDEPDHPLNAVLRDAKAMARAN